VKGPIGRFCGAADAAAAWQRRCGERWADTDVLLLLAATETAAVSGISAAGSTPESRRRTAAADAELLTLGPEASRPHALPPLPAGVTPALISRVVVQELGLQPLVLDLGCEIAPAVPHLRLPAPAGDGPARCLSGGRAMDPARVEALLSRGRAWGARRGPRPGAPLLIAECVPGGTTTAQAVLTGLGFAVAGLVSGSLHRPAHGLKAELVARGLRAAGLPPTAPAADPSLEAARARRVLAALGDPMQPLAAGLVLGAVAADRPVLLAGGSQMAAVLALALALAPRELRPRLAAAVAVATTAWVASEPESDLPLLLRRVGERWGLEPLGFAAALRFRGELHPALADYERGYVKEGVGAGGLALLWELSGRRSADLARLCDAACQRLLPRPAPRLRRRQLLGAGALAGVGLLSGCGAPRPLLLASRGDLPQAWSEELPKPWRVELRDDPAAVVAALASGTARPAGMVRRAGTAPALLQLSDGWASTLDPAGLQPIGSEALLARLTAQARAVSRLFARGPGAGEAPPLAYPFSLSPWVLLLRERPDLARRAAEGWDLLLDPSLRGQLVLPSSPRVAIALVNGDADRLRRLRAQALAYNERDGLNLLLAGEAQALVLPRRRVVPLLQRDPRLQAVLPESGAPLTWNLLVRPAGPYPAPPLEWLAAVLEPPLLPRLLASGWVPPVPRSTLERACAGFPPPLRALLLPPPGVMERCSTLLPLGAAERRALQKLWDQ
jgi:uncharacterized protein (TIGR00303 family)